MHTPSIIWLGVFVGSTIGGLIPELWGADFLSFSSVIFSGVGGILGVWAAYRLTQY
jgi:predicted MFS family arabinose efflux permease